jgi:hypothetical protein
LRQKDEKTTRRPAATARPRASRPLNFSILSGPQGRRGRGRDGDTRHRCG